jgi:hypothetical protein
MWLLFYSIRDLGNFCRSTINTLNLQRANSKFKTDLFIIGFILFIEEIWYDSKDQRKCL